MEVNKVKKIVVIGPESTGKSTLCAMLAHHFKTEWCAEFARDFLLTNGTNYTFDDLAIIAKGQLALEDEATLMVSSKWEMGKGETTFINTTNLTTTHHSPMLFIDTDMYVMKVWCEYVFGKCHQFILEEIIHRKYDLYLLCNIDLPWVKDELREYPDEQPRQELYKIYKDLLMNQSVPWVEISGTNDQRFDKAIEAVQRYIK
jgi:nicotinamide riboside kinase